MHVFMYVWATCAYGGQRTNLGIVPQMPSTSLQLPYSYRLVGSWYSRESLISTPHPAIFGIYKQIPPSPPLWCAPETKLRSWSLWSQNVADWAISPALKCVFFLFHGRVLYTSSHWTCENSKRWEQSSKELVSRHSARRSRSRAVLPWAREADAFPRSHLCCCEQRAGHAGWPSSTCNLTWALCPTLKTESLSELGLEGRISWHLSSVCFIVFGCQA